MKPVVHHLIACENIEPGERPGQFTLRNVTCKIRSLDPVPFPLLYRELCLIAFCTECRGNGVVRIKIFEEDTAEACYESPGWKVSFANDPLKVVGFPFRIRNLLFPRPGAYTIRFIYDSDTIAEHSLRLTE